MGGEFVMPLTHWYQNTRAAGSASSTTRVIPTGQRYAVKDVQRAKIIKHWPKPEAASRRAEPYWQVDPLRVTSDEIRLATLKPEVDRRKLNNPGSHGAANPADAGSLSASEAGCRHGTPGSRGFVCIS